MPGGTATDGTDTDVISNVENVEGTQYNDSLTGNNDNNQLISGDGDDVLKGNHGNDSLFGGNNNDVLIGGKGNDTLSGEKGIDLFVFESSSNDTDTIEDFETSYDVIIIDPFVYDISDLSEIGFSNSGSDGYLNINGQQTIVLKNVTIDGNWIDDHVYLDGSWTANVLANPSSPYFLDVNSRNNWYNSNDTYNAHGNQKIDALGGDDTVYGALGNHTLNGGEGIDVLDYSGLAVGDQTISGLKVNLHNNTIKYDRTITTIQKDTIIQFQLRNARSR